MSTDAMMYNRVGELEGWEDVEFCKSTRVVSNLTKTGAGYAERLAAENSPEICGANADGKLFLGLLFGDKTEDDWLGVW